MRSTIPVLGIFIIQALCAVFFVSDILSSFFGFITTPLAWEYREYLEIAAAFGLIIGLVLGGFRCGGPSRSAALPKSVCAVPLARSWIC